MPGPLRAHVFTAAGTCVLPHQEREMTVDPSAAAALRRSYLEGVVLVAAGNGDEASDHLDLAKVAPGDIVTLCEIKGRPDERLGRMSVVLEARMRAVVIAVADEPGGPVIWEPVAEAELTPEIRDQVSVLSGGFIQAYRRLSEAVEANGQELRMSVADIEHTPLDQTARTIDRALGQLPLSASQQRDLLQSRDLPRRLETATATLNELLVRVRTSRDMKDRLATDLENSQRAAVLRMQLKLIQKELADIDPQSNATGDYRKRIETAALPEAIERKALEDVERLETIPSFSPETNILRSYLDTLLALPWNSAAPATPDLTALKTQLDADHYGLEKVKDRIVDFVATQVHAGSGVRNPILCLVGAPGTGKTSIARSIARALGRKYHRIALGGVRDEAEIRGHRRTYIGALPGRIIQGLKTVGDGYAVMVLDEIDKVQPGGFSGDPAAALLEVLDPEQNREFVDHYLEVPFDLSRIMFVCTANYVDQIPPALRDRMDVVRVTGYTEPEKLAIARGYVIPKLLSEISLTGEQFRLDDETLSALIDGYTREAGVRDLERKLKTLIAKVVRGLIEDGAPPVIDRPALERYLGPALATREQVAADPQVGSSTGLFYSEAGGGTLTIEANLMLAERPEIVLTGSLGDTMKESARVALTYLHSRAQALGIDAQQFSRHSVHVHVPEGATPKDGPSAGLAIAAALRSALTGVAVRQDVAMTGEIDTRGRARRIGGLKEKLFGAKTAGCKRVLIPQENARDLAEVPGTITDGLDIVPVSTFEDVWKAVAVPTIAAPDLHLIGETDPGAMEGRAA